MKGDEDAVAGEGMMETLRRGTRIGGVAEDRVAGIPPAEIAVGRGHASPHLEVGARG
jgi:hypothetical protein